MAEGAVFSEGAAVLRWCVHPHSTGLYASVGDLIQVHGQEGRTTLQAIDQPIPAEVVDGSAVPESGLFSSLA